MLFELKQVIKSARLLVHPSFIALTNFDVLWAAFSVLRSLLDLAALWTRRGRARERDKRTPAKMALNTSSRRVAQVRALLNETLPQYKHEFVIL